MIGAMKQFIFIHTVALLLKFKSISVDGLSNLQPAMHSVMKNLGSCNKEKICSSFVLNQMSKGLGFQLSSGVSNEFYATKYFF